MAAPSELQSAEATAEGPGSTSTTEPPKKRGWRQGWTRRRIAGVGGVVVLLVGAVAATWAISHNSSSASSASPLAVTTQKVTVSTGTIKQTVSASGTIQPASQADLSFGVSGQVTAVDVKVGESVAAGQTLATVDPTALQYEVNAATQSLSSAQARLSGDQADRAATSQIDSDEASVTSAQSQLASAQQNLADANLTSTIAGTVASVDLTVGQSVSGSGSNASSNSSASNGSSGLGSSSASSSSSSSGSSQIVVVSTNSFNVDSTVDDTEVGQIKIGDQAVITPSGSTTTVYGTVSSVGLVAESSGSTSSVASFPVVVAVTGHPAGLYAGTSATMSITTKQLTDVVEVPTSAISYSNGESTVTKVVGGKQVSQPVTTGAAASGETQITNGVKAGDVVIERVVKFNGTTGAGRNLLGGGTGTARTRTGFTGGGFGGGGFGGGGFGGGGNFSGTGG